MVAPLNAARTAQRAVPTTLTRFLGMGCVIVGWMFLMLGSGLAALPTPNLDDYLVESWKTEEGLPDNMITAITQTRDGYLWLKTSVGLVRFDGVNFVVVEGKPSHFLKGAGIECLFSDRAGNLWVGTQKGLVRYGGGQFTRFTTQDGLSSNTVTSISEDPQGGIWICTPAGLDLFKDGGIVHRVEAGQLAGAIPGRIACDAEGQVWIGTTQGLRCWRDGQIRAVPLPKKVEGKAIGDIVASPHGNLSISMGDAGLVRLEQGQWRDLPDLPHHQVWAIHESRNGDMWVATQKGAVRIRSEQATVFTTAHGLSQDVIRSLFEDREGNLWVGTGAGGLNRLKPKRLKSHPTSHSDVVKPIFQDRAGILWFGLDCGGVDQVRDDRVVPLDLPAVEIANSCIYAIAQTPDSAMWFGTWGGGLFRLLGNRCDQFTKTNGLSQAIQAARVDRKGELWVGSYDDGLFRFTGSEFVSVTDAAGRSVKDIRVILDDHLGNVWVGSSEEGLARIQNGQWTRFGPATGLNTASVITLHEDQRRRLWIGTSGGGLICCQQDRFVALGKQQGLPDDIAGQILEDKEGNLWIGCNQGIYRLDRRELDDYLEGRRNTVHPILLGRADGMPAIQCTRAYQPAGCQTLDGKLWFGTSKGIVMVDPARFPINEVPPTVLVERVVVDDEPLWDADTGLQPEKIIVPAGTRKMEIHYAGLSFSLPAKVQYKCRLDGLEKAWVNVGSRRAAYYTSLVPGEYQFHVSACNNDGVWNESGAVIRFAVLPLYWQTAWFRAFAIMGVVALAFFVYHKRVAQLELEKGVQTEFARQLIESQENERKRIAGELHDSLEQNLLVIKNQALLALDARDVPETYPDPIREISEVATAAIEEVRTIAHNLRPYQLDRLGLTRALRSVVRSVAESSALDFTTRIEDIDGRLSKESEINLYRIVQESLNNILKHAQASQARVEIGAEGNQIRVAIEDNGRGFKAEGVPEDAGARRHFGLTGMAERIKIMAGALEISSRPGEGTKIWMRIPLDRKA